MRDGAQYFLQPGGSSQRRYEAMRAYFVEGMSASVVATQFGYSTASVHQMATLLRSGKMALFVDARPGPKGPRLTTKILRTRALELRAAGHSVTEISGLLTREGLPVSAQTIWQILDAEGIPRLPRRAGSRPRPSARPTAGPTGRPRAWPPRPLDLPCEHAGLLLMLPAMSQLKLHELVGSAGFPSAGNISCWQAIGSLLLAKCAPWARKQHVRSLGSDLGLAFAMGLTDLPSVTDLAAYSWQVDRASNRELLVSLIQALRPLGLATGDAGFNCDLHRTQPAGSGLTFYAQDHASGELIYASNEIGRGDWGDWAKNMIEFAGHWRAATRTDPGLLVFSSQLTTYRALEELTGGGLHWLCPRPRGQAEVARLAALPASAWQALDTLRHGRYHRARLHEELIKLKGVNHQLREIAVTSADTKPVLLISNDPVTPARDLFTRYVERPANAGRAGTRLNASRLDTPSSVVPVNADLDTTLNIILGYLYRLLARTLSRHETAALGGHWWRFLETPGSLNITRRDVTCSLQPRLIHPALLDIGLADLEIPIPWWESRTLRFRIENR